MSEEEDLDALQLDFSRLSASIQSELRRLQGGNTEVPSDSPFAKKQGMARYQAPPFQAATFQAATADSHLPPPGSTVTLEDDGDDDEVPTYYAVREQLYDRINSRSSETRPAPKAVPLMQPSDDHVIRIEHSAKPKPTPPPSAEFIPPRATLSPQQLRNAANVGAGNPQRSIRAVGQAVARPEHPEAPAVVSRRAPAPPGDRESLCALESLPPSCVRFSRAAHPSTLAAVAARPSRCRGQPANATASVFLSRGPGAVPPAVSGADTAQAGSVVLNARRPGAPGGPAVLAGLSFESAASACKGNAPTSMPMRPVDISAADDLRMPHVAPRECGARDDDTMPSQDSSGEMLFGHLAMKAALASHRAHYEAARAKVPGAKPAKKPIAVTRPAAINAKGGAS